MTNLATLIDTIDTRAGEIEIAFSEPPCPKGIIERVNERENAYRKLMADLAREHRANHRDGNTHVLTLAGIRVSCTAGVSGLIAAWLRKARAQDARENGGTA